MQGGDHGTYLVWELLLYLYRGPGMIISICKVSLEIPVFGGKYVIVTNK